MQRNALNIHNFKIVSVRVYLGKSQNDLKFRKQIIIN